MKAIFFWLLVKLGERSIRSEEGRGSADVAQPLQKIDNTVVPSYHRNPFFVRVRNFLWELRLGISTHGRMKVNHPDAYHYGAMSYGAINRILRFLRLQPRDVFIDIGSGKGRVLCLAARCAVRKVIGIESSPELSREACRNIKKMRGKNSPIVLHNVSAEVFDYKEGTIFFLFNPFGEDTLEEVLTRIWASLQLHPRSIRIAYANPLHDNVFGRMGWLQQYEYWDGKKLGIEHSVAFYKSLP